MRITNSDIKWIFSIVKLYMVQSVKIQGNLTTMNLIEKCNHTLTAQFFLCMLIQDDLKTR